MSNDWEQVIYVGVGALIFSVAAFISPWLVLFCSILWVLFKIDEQKRRNHFARLLEEREGLSICDFARSFDCRKVDTKIIRAVYEELGDFLPELKPAPNCNAILKAEDDLWTDLRLDEDDVDLDLVEILAERANLSIKAEDWESNPYVGNIKTVHDLVMCFNALPKREINA